MLADITPLILTRDEDVNIARTLGQLGWAREVVIVDSISTDRTVAIAEEQANVRVVQRPIDTLAGQTIFGIGEVRTPWTMLLDADYFVTDALIRELEALRPPDDVDAYVVSFVYAMNGRPLRASLYPPRIVVFRTARAEVWQDGHAPRFRMQGRVDRLRGTIIHDDRKPFARFVARQRTYMRQEAAKLRAAKWRDVNLAGKIRKLRVVAPFAVLAHTLIVKKLIFDGIPGLRYTFERVLAEAMLSWELMKGAGSSDRP